MRRSAKIFIAFLAAAAGFSGQLAAQPCSPSTPTFTLDFSSNPDTVWFSPDTVRSGLCCSASNPERCMEFIITLNPFSTGIKFDIYSGAIPPGALFYEISCTNPTMVGDTMCLSGPGPHRITFCKPGNNKNVYTITTIGRPDLSDPITVSDGCSDSLFASGLVKSTIRWRPVPFDTTYNGYLSCTAGCDTTIVTAGPGYPPFVDYEVRGLLVGGCSSDTIIDTVRVFFVSDKAADIQPDNPSICFGGSNAVIYANGSGGAPPYTYIWSTGETTDSIYVGVGTYWVEIRDSTNCPPVYDTVTVVAFPSAITADAGPDQVLCADNPVVNLSGKVNVATGGKWTGGGGMWSPGDDSLNTVYTPTASEIGNGFVKLYLTTTGNGSCPPETDSVLITLLPSTAADFQLSNICTYDTLTFTNTSTYDSGFPVSWQWDFGDGSTDTVKDPRHYYATGGTYTVTLIITSAGLCSDTVQKTISVFPRPSALFTIDAECFSDSVRFTDLSTISGDTIAGWLWDFGDGSTSSQPNPVYWYGSEGTYTVRLIVTTANGCSDTLSQSFDIHPSPVADFVAGNLCMNSINFFTDSSVVGSGNIVSWQWNFGDGATDTVQNPSHLYGSDGTYTVTLIVTTAFNCSDTVAKTVTVYPAPTALFNVLAECFIDSVFFADSSFIGNGSITGRLWNFGDGTTDTVKNPVHLYLSEGTYTVTLTVTTANGCTDSISRTFSLHPAPAADFLAGEVCSGNPTVFTDGSSIASGGIVSWQWDFGDGSTSAQPNPVHLYNTPGTYNVTLIVTSQYNCTDTIVKTVTVNPLPVAGFFFSGTCLNAGTRFTDSSIVSPGGIVKWFWDFGDGTKDTTQNPVHLYAASGGYIVSLIVETDKGCRDTVVKSITINPTFPAANFIADKKIVIPGEEIRFEDRSFDAISWFWDFGDSTGTSTMKDPRYIYTDTGYYRVMLVVSNQYGCTDTAWLDILVQLPPKVPNVFSPNGDGRNDILWVNGGPFVRFEFRIYNRWGELIFISNSQGRGWDGTRDGVEQPMGVYVYTLRAESEDGEEYDEAGDVSLLR